MSAQRHQRTPAGPSRPRRRLLGAFLFGLTLAQVPRPASAARLARRVKAAFLYKFLGYVEWPLHRLQSPTEPISIGVIDADDIADELQNLLPGRTVKNHPVAVRRVGEDDSLEGLHLLFVGQDARTDIATLARRARERGILLVSETAGALEEGSMINFLPVRDRVRFEVAMPSVERAGLKLSSRLLGVASHVETGSL